jgi:hypothetical protein
MRIEKVSILDKQSREFKMHKEHSLTSDVDIRAKGKTRCAAFWIRQPTDETSHVKLKLRIKEIGKEPYWKDVESVLVPPERFPLENPFRTLKY